jgi:uncharacterized membrane protein
MLDSSPAHTLSEVHASVAAADPHPPLYFFVVHFLFKIFGYTPVVARMLSVIFGVAAIYAIYRLGKELFNKHTGLVAGLMLCVNGYHIYYSQEARPYSMLCLFAICSFLYLARFIKNPTRQSALWYGVFTALMLYGHFFSLFALVSQGFVVLFFLIIKKKEERKPFFINAMIAWLIAFVLFLPSAKIFYVAMGIQAFWIPAPTPNVYSLIFQEFFGGAEIILFLLGVFGILYFVGLARQRDTPLTYEAVTTNKKVFGFVILASWIVFIILLPLVRSYMSVPMIISRYFINTLPAIIILVSAGMCQFKNRLVKMGVACLFLIFSLVDLVVVKNYYNIVTKTQFREMTQFIANNNQNGEPVATSLGWYFNYFLNNDKHKYAIIDRNLDVYIQEMLQDSTKIKAFWYVDGHIRPYNVTPQTQQFLDKHFAVAESSEMFDIWTKHYVLIKDLPTQLNLVRFGDIKDQNGDSFRLTIEAFELKNNLFKASGWAYFDNQDTASTSVTLVLVKDNIVKAVQTSKVNRPDVTLYFRSAHNIDSSGFSVAADLSRFEPGTYRVGLYLVDKLTRKEGLILTDKIIQH